MIVVLFDIKILISDFIYWFLIWLLLIIVINVNNVIRYWIGGNWVYFNIVFVKKDLNCCFFYY